MMVSEYVDAGETLIVTPDGHLYKTADSVQFYEQLPDGSWTLLDSTTTVIIEAKKMKPQPSRLMCWLRLITKITGVLICMGCSYSPATNYYELSSTSGSSSTGGSSSVDAMTGLVICSSWDSGTYPPDSGYLLCPGELAGSLGCDACISSRCDTYCLP